jgi:aryl-alcohol dehydrogenase (NADP+)
MTFGVQADESAAHAILNKAADGGVTFIDTADVYPIGRVAPGTTEEIIGAWLKDRRHDFIVATKCFAPMSGRPWDMGNSRKHILDAIDASLRRLQTDYIDLYQLHFYDQSTPIDETLRALDDVVRSGKVRYIGCSNFLAYQLARAIGRSEALNLVRFESVQPRYNLLFREIERELLPLCDEEKIGVIPYNPIAGGLLSGKHSQEGPEEGSRFTFGAGAGERYRDRYWHEGMFGTVEQLKPLAEQAGMTLARMAIAWLLANPVITAPIVGASRAEQLDETLQAVEKPLDPDLKTRLDEMTAEYRRGDTLR